MHEPEGARPRAPVAIRGRLPLPDLPRPRSALRRRARCAPWPSRPGRSSLLALGAGMVLRVDHIALLGFLIDPTVLDAVFVLNLGILLYRLVAIVDAYRVADYLNGGGGLGRRPGRPRPVRPQPAVDRRPARDHPGHGRQPRRRGALRHARRATSSTAAASSSATTPRRATSTPRRAPATRVGRDRDPERRRQRRLRRDRLARPGEHARRHRRPERVDPAVGRQGAAQHPAHRRRPAARRRRLQHRHADRRVDRSADQAGRDVQPAARHGRRADPAGAGPERLRARRTRARSTATGRPSASARTSTRARATCPATTASSRSSAACTASTSSTSSRSTSTASRRSSTSWAA